MGKCAEQTANGGVAFADASGFAPARRFVVAGTDAHPRGQPIGAAEGGHVGTDLHEQHGRADPIDAAHRVVAPKNRGRVSDPL